MMDERGPGATNEGVNEKLSQLYTDADDQIHNINQLGDRHARRTRCRKALDLCNEALVVGGDTVNADFPVAFWQIQAICYRHLREYENSIRTHRSILENLQQAKRPDQDEILKWRYNLAKELLTAHDKDKSKVAELDDAVVQLCGNVDRGPNARFSNRSLVSLSLGLVKQSRVQGTDERKRQDLVQHAETCSLEAINKLQHRMESGPKHGDAELLLEARHNLAVLYHRLAKFPEAETLFVKNQATLRALTDKIPGYNIYAGVAERYLAFYYQKSLQDDSGRSDLPSTPGKVPPGNQSMPSTVQTGQQAKQDDNVPRLVLPKHDKPKESTSNVTRQSSVKSDGGRSRSKSPQPHKSEDRRHSINIETTKPSVHKPSTEATLRTTPVESTSQLPASPVKSDAQNNGSSGRSRQLDIPQGSTTRVRSSSHSRQLTVPQEPKTRPRSSSWSSAWLAKSSTAKSQDATTDTQAEGKKPPSPAPSSARGSSTSKDRSPKREPATKPQTNSGETVRTKSQDATPKSQVLSKDKVKTPPVTSTSGSSQKQSSAIEPSAPNPPSLPKLQVKPVDSSSYTRETPTQADRGRTISTKPPIAKSRSADGRQQGTAPSTQEDVNVKLPSREELLRARIAQHDEVIGELMSSNDEAVSWAKLWFLRLRRWTHADLLKYHENTGKQAVHVRVAILDSGYNPKRSDIIKVRKQFKGYRDFVNTDNTIACDVDPEEHGTNCFSLLARVAPAAHIYVANVVEKTAKGKLQPSWTALRDALEWALTEDVDIISMSCGLHKLVDEVSEKLDMVKAHRKLMVVAIPNTKPEGYDYDNFPSFDSSVLSINARRLDWTTAVQPWSKKESAILFPGENVPILGNDDKQIPGTQLLTGTSFATPLAAGTMALIFDLLLRVDPKQGKSSPLYRLLLQPRHAATVLRGMSESVQQNIRSFSVMPWMILGQREPLQLPKSYAEEVPEVTEKQVFTASLIKTILEIESLQQHNG